MKGIHYTIYKITSPSGKVYIGQTKNPETRLLAYKWFKTCNRQKLISNSIQKYGYKAHTQEILMKGLSKKEADKEEIRIIKIYKALGISLNISDGGHLVSYTRRIGVVKCNLKGEYIEEFNSGAEASASIGIGRGTVGNVAKNKIYYCQGFLWILKKDWENGEKPFWKAGKVGNSTARKKINQFDLQGNYIATFNSKAEAERACKFGISVNTKKSVQIKRTNNYIFSTKNKVKPYSYINNRHSETKYNSKAIKVWDKDNNFLGSFPSINSAEKNLKIGGTILVNALNNKQTRLKIKVKQI